MTCLLLVQLGRKVEFARLRFGVGSRGSHTETVVLDVGLGHLYQQHVSGDASVVPPVENLRRHVFSVTFVVNLHDDRVLTLH